MPDNRPAPSIGIIFHPTFPPETLADFARRAEAAGFDALWLWDDCFLPGALTSAAIALSATQQLKVGIGLIPVPVYNPLFAAMEITTLARAFPNRILPGFGHGVGSWMEQIGAAPKSSMKALKETVLAVRQLLSGELITMQGDHVHLNQVQMRLKPSYIPPLFIGAIREKSLQLSGRIGDGTILTDMSSPAYIRWALSHIHAGMAETGRTHHHLVVYLGVKVSADGKTARDVVRRLLAERLPWDISLTAPMGITAEVASFVQTYKTIDEAAREMPDEWVDALVAAGTPDQVKSAVQRWVHAGADTIVFQPLDGDPDCFEEYLRYLSPIKKWIG